MYIKRKISHLLELVVNPSLKEVLWRQLEEVINVLAWQEEVDEAGHLGDGDLLEEVHLDELPHHAQHQVLLTLARVERVAVNTNHNTADSLGKY